jgi:hypothetical protein
MGGTVVKWSGGGNIWWSSGTNRRWYLTRRRSKVNRGRRVVGWNVSVRRPDGIRVLHKWCWTLSGAKRWAENEDQFYKEKAS